MQLTDNLKKLYLLTYVPYFTYSFIHLLFKAYIWVRMVQFSNSSLHVLESNIIIIVVIIIINTMVNKMRKLKKKIFKQKTTTRTNNQKDPLPLKIYVQSSLYYNNYNAFNYNILVLLNQQLPIRVSRVLVFNILIVFPLSTTTKIFLG